MRVNAPRGGTILRVNKDEKRRPGAFTTIPVRFMKTRFRGFWPPGEIRKNKKSQTSHTLGDTINQEKKAHTYHTDTATARQQTSHTHTATARQQQQQVLLIMSQPSSTEKAPVADKSSTDDQSNSRGEACVVLTKRRPRGRPRRPQFPRLCFAVAQNIDHYPHPRH